MVLLQQKHDRFFEDGNGIELFLKNKESDCILYSTEGVKFNIHKEILYQTKFLQNILQSAQNTCCRPIEIICPCSETDLNFIVNFLYRY